MARGTYHKRHLLLLLLLLFLEPYGPSGESEIIVVDKAQQFYRCTSQHAESVTVRPLYDNTCSLSSVSM